MLNNFDFDWDDVWQSIAVFAVIGAAVIIGMVIFADKQIRYYYLDNTSEGMLRIVPDIDWCDDSSHSIKLDRNITYDEALNMVNRMNKELKERDNIK